MISQTVNSQIKNVSEGLLEMYGLNTTRCTAVSDEATVALQLSPNILPSTRSRVVRVKDLSNHITLNLAVARSGPVFCEETTGLSRLHSKKAAL